MFDKNKFLKELYPNYQSQPEQKESSLPMQQTSQDFTTFYTKVAEEKARQQASKEQEARNALPTLKLEPFWYSFSKDYNSELEAAMAYIEAQKELAWL